MSKFNQYRRTNVAEMTPWTEDMDTTRVSISKADLEAGSPKEGDMIARNPENHDDQWLVAKDYFEKNFAPMTAEPHTEADYADAGTVFPSQDNTVFVEVDDEYGGAHRYTFINSLGFNDGEAQYEFDKTQTIQFVKKESNGTMVGGLQTEQLLLALIDRHRKLNAKFPDVNGEKALNFMEKALMSLEARVKSRMSRGVMGQLKK